MPESWGSIFESSLFYSSVWGGFFTGLFGGSVVLNVILNLFSSAISETLKYLWSRIVSSYRTKQKKANRLRWRVKASGIRKKVIRIWRKVQRKLRGPTLFEFVSEYVNSKQNIYSRFDLLLCVKLEKNYNAGIRYRLKKKELALKAVIDASLFDSQQRGVKYVDIRVSSYYILYVENDMNGKYVIYYDLEKRYTFIPVVEDSCQEERKSFCMSLTNFVVRCLPSMEEE